MKSDFKFPRIFILWFCFCVVGGLATLGGVGYAIYWGLSIAEKAVEADEHQN